MYIKDEDLILENFQKRIDDEEEVILTPSKVSTILIIVFLFTIGSLGFFAAKPSLMIVGSILWIIPVWQIFCLFSKDGQLALDKEGIEFCVLNDSKKILWADIQSAYQGYGKPFYFLTLSLKDKQIVKISRYEYKDLEIQTLIKLFEKNFQK